jgi:hypothetical protein
MKYTMHEMLTKAGNGQTKEKKIKLLRKFDSPELRSLVKSSYDPSIVWLLPEGDVPYNKKDYKLGDGSHKFLFTEISTLYHFVKGGNNALKSSKREQMFIELLESLHETEAELLILAKDKGLYKEYKLSDNVIREAFNWNSDYCKV